MDTTFTFDGASITIGSPTVRDRNRRIAIVELLQDGDKSSVEVSFHLLTFGDFITAVRRIDGDFPVRVPAYGAPLNEYREALEAYSNLPAEFQDAFNEAYTTARFQGNSASKKTVPTEDSSTP